MKKILFVGETWVHNITHIKGYDTFVTCHYEDASHYLTNAIKSGGYDVKHIAAHEVAEHFPNTYEKLQDYAAIVLSDVGSNTFYLTNNVFFKGKSEENSLDNMKHFVNEGGGLLMVGGYMSFTGIEAKARFGDTPLDQVLPVTMYDKDDRAEYSQGVKPIVTESHPILEGIEHEWMPFLGYNRLLSKENSNVIMKIGDEDVFLAAGEFDKGRSVAFASDCAPHWATMDFVNWKYYNTFWANIISWICNDM